MSVILTSIGPNQVNDTPAVIPPYGPNYIDPVILVISVLRADAGFLFNEFGGALPELYDPSQTGSGPAVVVTVKGGLTHPEMPLQKFSMQVKAWAGVNEFIQARYCSYLAFKSAHGVLNTSFGQYGFIVSLLESTPGIEVVDPDSGWSTVVSTFELLARSN